MKQVITVIPARFASSRFPGKPLEKISNKTAIQRAWEIATAAKNSRKVLIATDSTKIADFVRNFGAEVIMTDSSVKTGTDRVFQALRDQGLGGDDIVLSFQGDAVLTPPKVLEKLIDYMLKHSDSCLATPYYRLEGQALQDFVQRKKQGSSSGTLVVFNKNQKALYFSKTLIPSARDGLFKELHQHIGIYAYRWACLEKFVELPASSLERIEKLEQLRALDNGIAIDMVEVDLEGRSLASVDNPEDIEIIEAIIRQEGELLND